MSCFSACNIGCNIFSAFFFLLFISDLVMTFNIKIFLFPQSDIQMLFDTSAADGIISNFSFDLNDFKFSHYCTRLYRDIFAYVFSKTSAADLMCGGKG